MTKRALPLLVALVSSGCFSPTTPADCQGASGGNDCFEKPCSAHDDCAADQACVVSVPGYACPGPERCCLPVGRCTALPNCPAGCAAVWPAHQPCFECDCSARPDAAAAEDASAPDVGPAPRPDAAAPDVGVSVRPDAGAGPDAGAFLPPDGGTEPDAATPDAGVLLFADGGAGPDAAWADAGEGACRLTFTREDYLTGWHPDSVNVADLDGDGLPDLALSATYETSFFLNQGAGAFGQRQDLDLASSDTSLALADLDGDGAVDLVRPDGWGKRMQVRSGDGRGGCGPTVDYATGGGAGAAAVGDLDGDGLPDLAFSGERTGVLRNLGGRQLSSPASLSTVGGIVAIADVDRDGSPDVVAAVGSSYPQTGHVSVFLNQGGGAFAAGLDTATGINHPTGLAIGDLDGDGAVDLAISSYDRDLVALLYGAGDGTTAGESTFATGEILTGAAAGDLDHDGRLDLAVANGGSGTITVLLNQGGRAFASKDVPVGPWPTSLAFADLDGDGWVDIAVTSSATTGSPTVSVLLNTCK